MLNLLKNIVFLSLVLNVFASCSVKKKNKTPTNFSFVGFSGSADFPGGVMIWGKSTSGLFFGTAINSDTQLKDITLENEEWQFMAVGWSGGSDFEGNTKCGSLLKEISETQNTVNISLTSNNCNNELFSDNSFKVGSIFNSLEFIACNDISAVSPGANCDSGGGKGNIKSYKIIMNEFSQNTGVLTGLSSSCIDQSGAASTTSTAYSIPVGVLGQYPFNTVIETYDSLACSGMKKTFHFPDGLINSSLDAKVISNSSTTQVFLESEFLAPIFNYGQSSISIIHNESMTNLTPTLTTGIVTAYSISPALPAGLSFNSTTGQIAGVPSNIQAEVNYTITGTGPGGTSTSTIGITTEIQVPSIDSFTNATASYYQNIAITSNVPSISGGIVSTWTVSPALPTGLVLNGASGSISGTATVVSSNQAYIVSATNASGTSTFNLSLEVVVFSAAVLTISEGDPYDFGSNSMGVSKSHIFTITKTGTADATAVSVSGLAAPYGFLGGVFPGSGGNCTTVISTSSCTIVLEYIAAQITAENIAINLNYHDGSANQSVEKNLTGVGFNPAVLTITESDPYDYGAVLNGNSSTHTFTITNTGGVNATSLSHTFTDSEYSFMGGFPGAGGNCTVTLAALASCFLVVNYTPSGVGIHSGNLNLSYNDGVEIQNSVRNLSGTGELPAVLNFVSSDLDFSVQAYSEEKNQLISINNVGNANATGITGHFSNAVFNYVGGSYPGTGGDCSTTIASSSGCNINVEFTSGASLETYSETLGLTFYNGVSSVTSILNLKGVATDISDVAVDFRHACAVFTSGHVKCWGFNDSGQLGTGTAIDIVGNDGGEMGDNLAVIDLGTGVFASKVVLGSYHTCVLTTSSEVKCFGKNFMGQLGLGNTTDKGLVGADMGDNLASVDLGVGRTAKDIAAGGQTTCAILDDDSVKCWGFNSAGQLGQGNTTNIGNGAGPNVSVISPIDFGSSRTAKAITVGDSFVCSVLSDDTAKCWGANAEGQLGQGDATNRNSPTALPDIDLESIVVIDIVAGLKSTCVKLAGTNAKCWGDGVNSQMGQDTLNDIGKTGGSMGSNLVNISLGHSVEQVGIYATHSCAILADTSLKCWGSGADGRTGHDNTTTYGGPANVMSGVPLTDLGSGVYATKLSTGSSSSSTCAILNNGKVKCWGKNDKGQLGLGDVTSRGVSAGGFGMGDSLPYVDL